MTPHELDPEPPVSHEEDAPAGDDSDWDDDEEDDDDDDLVDEASEESFPASDPPSFAGTGSPVTP